MKAAKPTVILGLVLMLFGLHRGYLHAGVVNRIVATVNGDIITLHELNASIKKFTGAELSDLQVSGTGKFNELRRAVLNTMINDKIAQQQIAKLEIKVSEKDIEESIEQVKRENNLTQEELLEGLKAEGITLEEYKKRIKGEIERFQLVNREVKSKIVVTEQEVKTHYQEHRKAYSQAHEVRLGRIFLSVGDMGDREQRVRARDLGAEIVQRVREGEDFSELAKRHSQGPSAADGGDLGWLALANLQQELRERIGKLSAGECTDLMPAPSGFQIIKVVDVKRAGIKPLEEVRDSIYSKLYKEKVEKRYVAWIEELRGKSFIKVIF
jgi:peptidyl-prolyl cis-trans isomerase SurA